MRTSRVRRRLGGPIWISAVRGRSGAPAPPGQSSANSGTSSASCRPIAGHQVDPEQLARGAVRQFHAALRVEPDHAGRDAGQHGLGEAAALVDLAVGLHQLGALRRELAGHAVEGAATARRSRPRLAASGTRAARSPPRTRSAAWISRPIGRAIWLAITRPISTAADSTSSATSAKIQPKAICSQERFWSSRSYSATAVLGAAPCGLGSAGRSAGRSSASAAGSN